MTERRIRLRWPSIAGATASLGIALAGCGGHRDAPRPAGSSSAAASASAPAKASASAASSASPPGSDSASAAGSASATAESPRPPVASFESARANKACKTATVDVAQYQQRGEVAVSGRKDRVAVTWLVQLAGRRQEQVAFATFDPEAKQAGRARGVGLSEHTAPRAFAVGNEWTISWFDERGFAYTHPHDEPLPAPDVQHLTAIGPGEDEAVAINLVAAEGLIAAVVLPSNKDQVALFRFAPLDPSAPGVKALGVTHHAKAPHHPAVAGDKEGVTVAWLEEGHRIAASHFDAGGKEVDAACTIAPKGSAERKDLVLASAAGGSVALWLEGTSLRARAVGPKGCPTGPMFNVGNGSSPRAVSIEGGVLASWVAPDGKLVAAKLGPNGQPSEKGLEIAEAVGGVKDPPSIALAGARAAFAWTEAMGPSVATRRLVLRTLDVACLP